MQGQRQNSRGGRQRRTKPRSESRSTIDPILIAARRPNSPLIASSSGRRLVAASARPQQRPPQTVDSAGPAAPPKHPRTPVEHKGARIVQLNGDNADATEKERLRLLDRFMLSEGRSAISRAANEYWHAGFQFPEEQEVQLKLLEHFDEACASVALDSLAKLLERQPPLQRPVLEMRLRRLEEYADDPKTREVAGVLRRAIR